MLLSIHELTLQITGWLPVQRGVKIEWDLQSTPLEIRTNSVLGSYEMARVFFYSAGGWPAGRVSLQFTVDLQYFPGGCSNSWIYLPVTPPSATEKVWRIAVTRTAGVRLVIHCNEVRVLNLLLSSTCSDSDWSIIWNRDVKKIEFWVEDNASDSYRPGT